MISSGEHSEFVNELIVNELKNCQVMSVRMGLVHMKTQAYLKHIHDIFISDMASQVNNMLCPSPSEEKFTTLYSYLQSRAVMEALGMILHLDEIDEFGDNYELCDIYYEDIGVIMDEKDLGQVIDIDVDGSEVNQSQSIPTQEVPVKTLSPFSGSDVSSKTVSPLDSGFETDQSVLVSSRERQSISSDSGTCSRDSFLSSDSGRGLIDNGRGLTECGRGLTKSEQSLSIHSSHGLKLAPLGHQKEEQNTITELLQSKGPKATSPTSAFLPPCRVCSDPASGFHYGVNTCEACKGFFRRSIIKVQQKSQAYKCKGKRKGEQGKCVLGPGKQNVCGACRYQKCLEVGMSQDAIKTGRYTYEKRTRDTMEVRKLQAKDGRYIDEMVKEEEISSIIEALREVQLQNSPELKLLQNEQYANEKKLKIYNDHRAKVETFGSMSVIPKPVWEEFFEKTGIDLDDRQELMRVLAERMEIGLTAMVDFVRTIPGFTDLTVADQTALIKTSHFEFWFMANYKYIDPDLRVIVGFHNFHESTVASLIREDFMDAVFKFTKSMIAINLTEEEIILLRGVVVTFTDRCTLEEPEKVEKIQWKLLSGIHVIAEKNKLNPNKRICKILDRLTELRSLTEISREIDKEKLQWPIMKDYPLVADVMSS